MPADFRLDLQNERLWHGSQECVLTPKPFAMLRHLVTHPNQLLTKERLLDAVWPGVHVTESQVKQVVQQLREKLGDDARAPRFIETVHGRGYRYIGSIEVYDGTPPPAPASAASVPLEPTGAERLPARLFGREAELSKLHQWLEATRAGNRCVGFVTGTAGIGKTALVGAFARAMELAGSARCGVGHCTERYGARDPYLPFFEAFESLSRRPDGDRVAACLARVAPTWLERMRPEHAEPRRPAGRASRARMLREAAQALESLAAPAPLLLLLEDIHWADESTLELIEYLARRTEPARLLVIGTFRPEFALNHTIARIHANLGARGQCRELALGPLGAIGVAAYLEDRLPGLPARAARLVLQRTDGHPLFVVNTVEHMVEQSLVTQSGGSWALRDDSEDFDVGIPDNLQHLIDWQFGQLEAEDRRLLEACSVAGFGFAPGVVAAAVEMDPLHLEERCERLARERRFLRRQGEVISPDGTAEARYEFLHHLYVDVLYRRLTPRRRAKYHLAIGIGLERSQGSRSAEAGAELAYHFERGGDRLRAAAYLEQAATKALRFFASKEAAALLGRAIELVGALPDTPERARRELALLLRLGPPLTAIEGFASPRQERVLMRAIDLARKLASDEDLFAALRGLHSVRQHSGDFAGARATADELLALAASAGKADWIVDARTHSGVSHFFAGDFLAARADFAAEASDFAPTPLDGASPASGIGTGSYRLTQDAFALWFLGYPDQAVARLAQAMAFARQLGNPFYVAAAVDAQAHLHVLRGEAGPVTALAGQLIALANAHDFAYLETAGTMFLGWARVTEGDVDAGVADMRNAIARFVAIRAVTRTLMYLPLLADACSRRGRTAEAAEAVASALSIGERCGANHWHAELLRLRAVLALQQGGPDAPRQAEALFGESLKIAGSQSAKSLALRTATGFARLLHRQGAPGKAKALLEPIFAWFAEGRGTRDLREAETLLENCRR